MSRKIRSLPKAPCLIAAAAVFAALAAAAPAQAAGGYRSLCSGQYCFHVSNFAKSRTIDGAGLWDVYYYISYGNNRWTITTSASATGAARPSRSRFPPTAHAARCAASG